MSLCSTLKFLVSSVSVALLASCSNNLQPVSVDTSSDNRTTAAVADLAITDVGWAPGSWGVGQLWAVSKQATGLNYYLAKYNFNTGRWEVKYNYKGLRCAVSTSGKCYYVNYAGELWRTSSSGSPVKLNTPRYLKVKDIAVASSIDSDYLRTVSSSSNYEYFGHYSGNGTVDWTQNTGWPVSAPKRISINLSSTSQGVLCDGNGVVYFHGDLEWLRGNDTSNTGFSDVACDGKVAAIKSSYLYISEGGLDDPFVKTTIRAKSAVATTILNDIPYLLYINSNDRLEYWPFSMF